MIPVTRSNCEVCSSLDHYFQNTRDFAHRTFNWTSSFLEGLTKTLIELLFSITVGKNQALAGAIPDCGEYPGPRFEDKFRSANQMDGISKAGEIKWLPVNL